MLSGPIEGVCEWGGKGIGLGEVREGKGREGRKGGGMGMGRKGRSGSVPSMSLLYRLIV